MDLLRIYRLLLNIFFLIFTVFLISRQFIETEAVMHVYHFRILHCFLNLLPVLSLQKKYREQKIKHNR